MSLVDSASILALVVQQGVDFFDLACVKALSGVCVSLREDLDCEWGWFTRCMKAGYARRRPNMRKSFVIDWKDLFISQSAISDRHRFQVSIDLTDVVIKYPIPHNLSSQFWYSEIKSAVFRMTSQGLHIHHAKSNGGVGNFFLPGQTAAFLHVLVCDCRGVCKVPSLISALPINFRVSLTQGRLPLPPLYGSLQQVFLTDSEPVTLKTAVTQLLPLKTTLTKGDITLIHPGGRQQIDNASNFRLSQDLLMLHGEVLHVDSHQQVRRNFWNTNDRLTYQGSLGEVKNNHNNSLSHNCSMDEPKVFTSRAPQILHSARDARQIEFSPLDPNFMLVGRRSGNLALVDCENDLVRSEISVDTSAILGLTCFTRTPRIAAYGASLSGSIGIVKFDTEQVVAENYKIGSFDQVSCLSVNCTDDLLLASGFTQDVSLFDVHTGKQIRKFENVHDNFINIVRFSHTMPHVYATCSFDASVKLWDLRMNCTGFNSHKPNSLFRAPTLNVMCAFSFDDRRLLVSGMDSHVYQLSVQDNLRNLDISHNIVAKHSHTNYRRSVYLSGSDVFATAGTDESSVRIVDANSGACCAELDFTGTISRLNGVSEFDINRQLRTPARLFGNLVSRLLMLGRRRITHGPETEQIPEFEDIPRVFGEYVQSLRAHPTDTRKVGVLLSPYERGAESVVAISTLTQTLSPSSSSAPSHNARQGL